MSKWNCNISSRRRSYIWCFNDNILCDFHCKLFISRSNSKVFLKIINSKIFRNTILNLVEYLSNSGVQSNYNIIDFLTFKNIITLFLAIFTLFSPFISLERTYYGQNDSENEESISLLKLYSLLLKPLIIVIYSHSIYSLTGFILYGELNHFIIQTIGVIFYYIWELYKNVQLGNHYVDFKND